MVTECSTLEAVLKQMEAEHPLDTWFRSAPGKGGMTVGIEEMADFASESQRLRDLAVVHAVKAAARNRASPNNSTGRQVCEIARGVESPRLGRRAKQPGFDTRVVHDLCRKNPRIVK